MKKRLENTINYRYKLIKAMTLLARPMPCKGQPWIQPIPNGLAHAAKISEGSLCL